VCRREHDPRLERAAQRRCAYPARHDRHCSLAGPADRRRLADRHRAEGLPARLAVAALTGRALSELTQSASAWWTRLGVALLSWWLGRLRRDDRTQQRAAQGPAGGARSRTWLTAGVVLPLSLRERPLTASRRLDDHPDVTEEQG
jgi:hypothetical protein